ncbi:hypothetical protein GW931_01535 [archaeon]|nr:hypothetical protein [archaeon]PJC45478.1 MAG: hypothetical protein CO037_01310 [Candidatus Pacearchaeota archaeon CG_4_9_14_0_2_um_filter_30_8]
MTIQNKKGQGMSTNTIILLILGLIVLVALVWGFATGWSAFQKYFNPSNVDSVIDDCNVACTLNNQYGYCSGERTLKSNEDNLKIKSSCAVFSSEKTFAKYKIPSCASISCDLKCEDIVIDGKKGVNSVSTGKYDVSSLAKEDKCFIN